MRITHIGPDSQFLQFAVRKFEARAPGSNHVVAVAKPGAVRSRYSLEAERVTFVSPSSAGVARTALAVRGSDMIIAHGMTPHSALAFSVTANRAVRVWSGWGFDYYGTDASPDAGLLGPETTTLVERLAIPPSRRGAMSDVARQGRRHALTAMVHNAARRTSFFAAIPEDFRVFRRRFPEFRGDYVQLNYLEIDDGPGGKHEAPFGRDLLVGNSASPSNNHLEAFEALATLALGSRRIVVPLSYGDTRYRDAIVKRGYDIFGQSFFPIVDFLPLDDYNAATAGCGVVVMNHRRQQAIGNISASLHRGAHVYLDEGNPVYQFFATRGAMVHPMTDLRSGELPTEAPDEVILTSTRKMIADFWGPGRVAQNVDQLLSKLAW